MNIYNAFVEGLGSRVGVLVAVWGVAFASLEKEPRGDSGPQNSEPKGLNLKLWTANSNKL